VSALELAVLLEQADAEKKLRAAGGVVDRARLDQARAVLRALP
jgi:hypothetical protein